MTSNITKDFFIVINVIERHGFHLHLYADDTQIYDFYNPSSTDQLQLRLSDALTTSPAGCGLIGYN